jgi:hypothetical protein
MSERQIAFRQDDDVLEIDFGWNVEPVRLTRQEAYEFYHSVGETYYGIDALGDDGESEDQEQFPAMQVGDVTLATGEVASFLDEFSSSLERIERLPIREESERPQIMSQHVNWLHEGF